MSLIQFLGGAEEIGRSAMLLSMDKLKLMFEYGLKPADPPQPPMPAPHDIDALFLTHCHLDHSGMVPDLVSRSGCRVYCTPLTLELSDLLANDSLKIAKEEGYPLPFGRDALRHMYANSEEVSMGDIIPLRNIEIAVHDAGHIPGAVMYEIIDQNTILYTGDLNTIKTNLVMDAKPLRCDILIMESTYAGREHPPRFKVEAEFVEKIHEVVDAGGKVIVPSFGVSRTQEILIMLMKERLSVWLDGMGRDVNRIYFDYPEYIRDVRRLKKAVRRVNIVRGGMKRERVLRDADVVITTSGMLNGGPVMDYISMIMDDPANAIFLTGYQVEGTNGRMLLEEGMIDLQGVKQRVECRIMQFDFSAHAGHSDLIRFARMCEPSKVILMHGNADERLAIANELKGEMDVILPRAGEKIEI